MTCIVGVRDRVRGVSYVGADRGTWADRSLFKLRSPKVFATSVDGELWVVACAGDAWVCRLAESLLARHRDGDVTTVEWFFEAWRDEVAEHAEKVRKFRDGDAGLYKHSVVIAKKDELWMGDCTSGLESAENDVVWAGMGMLAAGAALGAMATADEVFSCAEPLPGLAALEIAFRVGHANSDGCEPPYDWMSTDGTLGMWDVREDFKTVALLEETSP